MKALTRSFVWWPRIDTDIEDLVKSCVQCQVSRNKPGYKALVTLRQDWRRRLRLRFTRFV